MKRSRPAPLTSGVIPRKANIVDAFENLVASLLRNRGYWVETSFKVKLEKVEKVAIGRPSSPRWELDLIAYKAKNNELRVIECKSFLDSRGVSSSSFVGSAKPDRYKLFNDTKLREVVLSRLVRQLVELGTVRPDPKIQVCLAAGRIASERDRGALRKLFAERGWLLLDELWVRDELQALSTESYQNSVASVVSKLLLRGREV